MNEKERIPMKPAVTTKRPLPAVPFGSLQRKCACGRAAGVGGECPECKKKDVSLQHRALDNSEPDTVSPIAPGLLRSPGQPLHLNLRVPLEWSIGHVFGKVKVYADRTAAEPLGTAHAIAPVVGRVVARVPNGQPVLQRQAGPEDASPPKKESPPSAGSGSPRTEEESSGSGSGGSGTAPAAPICQPKGLDRAAFLAAPGTSKDVFGLTTLDTSGVTFPTVNTFPAEPHGVTVGRTSAALPTIPSFFTKVGVFVEGETRVGPGEDQYSCDPGKYPLKWIIGTQRIGVAEQEHCNDFQYAFEISLKKYAEAVNALADKHTVFPSHKAVEDALTRTTGVAPSKWQSVFNCLVQKSTLRDPKRPGDAAWHVPKPFFQAPKFPDCKEARAFISDASLPDVGSHPSSEIIEGCGEKPAPAAKAGKKAGER